MSYLTDTERLRLHLEWPDPSDTLGYADVSCSMLSLARHGPGITVNGHYYRYFPASDELWRDDVVKLVRKWRKAEAKTAPAQPTQVQGDLL